MRPFINPYLQSFKFSTLRQSSITLQIILLFTSLHCFGQAPKTDSVVNKNKNAISFAGAVIFQGQLMGEAGINYGNLFSGGPCAAGGFVGLKLTSEFSYYHNALLLGPKIGFELNSLIGFKLSVVNYTDFKTNDTRLVPEIGFGTGLNFYYGWNIPLSRSKFDVISKHRFSININIGKYL